MKDLNSKILSVISEAAVTYKVPEEHELHDLAHEHAGLSWNDRDPRDAYATGHHYEKATQRMEQIEHHVSSTYGPKALGHLKRFSNAMGTVLDAKHLHSREHNLNKTGVHAAQNLGIRPDEDDATDHAFEHQKM